MRSLASRLHLAHCYDCLCFWTRLVAWATPQHTQDEIAAEVGCQPEFAASLMTMIEGSSNADSSSAVNPPPKNNNLPPPPAGNASTNPSHEPEVEKVIKKARIPKPEACLIKVQVHVLGYLFSLLLCYSTKNMYMHINI